ncbi:MAG TPA: fibronectin type III domain-containing protein [Solirubrobacteraceae bacterium]|nr:fibronectin type III domain-containing protein [Solirubrobacteraceae bacterium]
MTIGGWANRSCALAVGALLAGGAAVSLAVPAADAHAGSARPARPSCAGRAPRDLRLQRLSGPRVRLSWRAPAGTAGASPRAHSRPVAYRVLLDGRTVGQTARTAMTLAVVLGRRTTFTVQARYAGAPQACSVRIHSRLALRPPGRVRDLRVLAVSAAGVRIGWRRARPGDAPIAGYRVFRDGAVVAQARALSYTLRLSVARSHSIAVAAVDTRGQLGRLSRPLRIGAHPAPTASHHAAAGDALPAAPGALGVAEVSDAGATLWWTPARAGSQRIIGYRVYRDEKLVGQTTQDSLRLTRLSSLRTYKLAVAAVDAEHREGPRTPTLSLTTTHTAPDGPALISALRVTDTSATLSWQAGAANSGTLVGYLLFQDGKPKRVVDGQSTTVALASEQRYTFTVRTLDSYGYLSAPAPNLTVVTTHTPPSTPGGLHATEVTADSAALAWSPSTPVSGQIVGYRVFRDGIPVGQTGATGMTLAELAPESPYKVTVEAVDSLGAISASTAPLAIQTANPPPTHGHVQAFLLASTDQSFFDLEAHYQQVGVVYPTYFECGAGGAVLGQDYPLVTDWARARQIAVMPRLNCQNPNDEDQILNEPAVGQHMIEQLAALCREKGYAGIQVDFEGAQPAEREPFTAWITALAAALHAQGDRLSTVVTAKYYNVTTGRAAMYDDAALSVPSDYIFVLDWGLHWTTSKPGGLDEMAWFKRVAEYTATMPNRSKFILGMPMYGIDWADGGGPSNPGTPLEYADVMALAAEYGATPEWDAEAADPHFSYTDAGGVRHEVWYTDQQSIAARVALAESLGLGVGLWHLGSEDQSVWELPGLGG